MRFLLHIIITGMFSKKSANPHIVVLFLYPFTGVQLLMRFQPMNRKNSQGAADARRRVHRRTFALQVLGNKADAVPCECLPFSYFLTYQYKPA